MCQIDKVIPSRKRRMRRIQFERSIHTPTIGNKSPINSIQFIEISISTPLHTKTVVRSVGRSLYILICLGKRWDSQWHWEYALFSVLELIRTYCSDRQMDDNLLDGKVGSDREFNDNSGDAGYYLILQIHIEFTLQNCWSSMEILKFICNMCFCMIW